MVKIGLQKVRNHTVKGYIHLFVRFSFFCYLWSKSGEATRCSIKNHTDRKSVICSFLSGQLTLLAAIRFALLDSD